MLQSAQAPRVSSAADATAEPGSLFERIARQATTGPSAVALMEIDGARTLRTITREAFVKRVTHISTALHASGFVAGDRVLFSVRPGIDAVALVLAVHALGGVLIPQDPGTADALFAARMALLKPQWVFAESALLVSARGLVARLLRWRGMHLAPLGAVPDARFVHVGPRLPGMPRRTSLASLVRQGQTASRFADAADVADAADAADTAHGTHASQPGDADAFIVCTSGTTSAPKAVVHTRRSLQAILTAVEGELALSEQHVVYSKDLHLVLPALCVGARVVIPRALTFSGDKTCDAIDSHKVTHAFLVSRDCRLLLDACARSGRTLSTSLRSLMIGAAPVRTGFLARLRSILPADCVAWCVYGATEVLPVARVSLEEKVAWGGDGDLVGRPIPGVSVRVADTPPGELLVSGDRLCRGYVGAAPMTEYATGDIARLDNGRIVLMGRAKDMLIRGDHNIYPELYEPLVERIAGVRRAAIVGDFDAVKADERIILVVEAEKGQDAERLRQRVAREVRAGPNRLDSSAQPDEIIVRPLPESGRSNKIDKAALRAALGLRDAGRA